MSAQNPDVEDALRRLREADPRRRVTAHGLARVEKRLTRSVPFSRRRRSGLQLIATLGLLLVVPAALAATAKVVVAAVVRARAQRAALESPPPFASLAEARGGNRIGSPPPFASSAAPQARSREGAEGSGGDRPESTPPSAREFRESPPPFASSVAPQARSREEAEGSGGDRIKSPPFASSVAPQARSREGAEGSGGDRDARGAAQSPPRFGSSAPDLAQPSSANAAPPARIPEEGRPTGARPESAPAAFASNAAPQARGLSSVGGGTAIEAPEDALSAETRLMSAAIHQLRVKRSASEALRTLDEYRRRFPTGTLAREAEQTRIDALLQAGRRDQLMAELATAEGNEPRLLLAELQADSGNCANALRTFDALLSTVLPGALESRALYGRALCRGERGDAAGRVADLKRYLERYPAGRYAPACREALQRAEGATR